MPTVPSTPLERPRQFLVLAYAVASLWYLHWRLGTFNPDALVFSWLVYAAELFGVGTAALHIFMCWRLSERQAPVPRVARSVDVFVPTYNESVDLVRKTLVAALAMDGAHTTWLLDDGRRPEMAALARELGCRYLTRPDNADAKAGNLNHALRHSSGELVVVFDADHAPRRDFLLKTLGYFDDERVAFVQTPQDFYNLDSFQHRRPRRGGTVWTEQALFFRVIQRGKDRWNAAFFCGSCAVVRRAALDSIGGFATGTVTEDLHTSIRLHAGGWRSVYHAEPLAFGLAPESIAPFIGQRVRWGQGAMHVWRREGLLTHKGLTWAQRLNYLASVLTYFDGWQKAVFYLAPVVVLTTATMPLITGTTEFLLHFVPYYLLTFWVFEEVGRGYGRSLIIEQYNMARFAAFAWATLAWCLPRLKFRVTPKGKPGTRALRFTTPHWMVLTLNVAAIPVGIALYLAWGQLPVEGLVANALWAGINGALALAVLGYTAVHQRNARASYRFPVPVGAELVLHDGSCVHGTVDDLSDRGLRFYGALPAGLAVGHPVTGRLWLPDGPIAIWGEVRSVVATAHEPDGVKAVGCSFSATADARRRLERFLFGSDLQWLVNGLSDRVHTPLSRWLPRSVGGPAARELAERRWNAAQLRVSAVAPPLPALVATACPGSAAVVASYVPLPEGRTLLLDIHLRRRPSTASVQLQRLPGPSSPQLMLYRMQAQPAMADATHQGGRSAAAAPANTPAALAGSVIARLRDEPGRASTVTVDPGAT